MSEYSVSHSEVRTSARLISLLRLLLLAIGLAVLTFYLGSEESAAVWQRALHHLQKLLLAVAVAAALLIVAVGMVRHVWQLVLHLVFDLLWIGGLIYLSGGVTSPGVPLLFALVLTSNLVLPSVAPFVISSLAALMVAASASFYLAGITPFAHEILPPTHPLIHPPRILGNLAVQVGALFLVDLLSQSLARRLMEQRVLTGELLDQLDEGVRDSWRSAASWPPESRCMDSCASRAWRRCARSSTMTTYPPGPA